MSYNHYAIEKKSYREHKRTNWIQRECIKCGNPFIDRLLAVQTKKICTACRESTSDEEIKKIYKQKLPHRQEMLRARRTGSSKRPDTQRFIMNSPFRK